MTSTTSSRNDHFQGYLSPPPNYQHSPPSNSASFSSFQFNLAPTNPDHQSQSARSANPNPHTDSSTAKQRHLEHQHQHQQDEHYLAKYRDMKQKVQGLELDNDRLHLKCLVVRKNIQRLRLERSILYERLQAMRGGGTLASNPVPQNQHHVPTIRHDSNPNQPLSNHEQLPLSQFQSTFMVKRTSARSPKASSSNKKRSSAATTPSSAPAIIMNQPSSSGQKQNVTTTPILAEDGPTPPSPTFHQVRNGNFMRTFPFVHEYSSSSSSSITHKPQRQSTPMHSEYPVEIKFHQYEAGTPDQRNSRKDGDEKGDGKQKRRGASGSQDINRTQQQQQHHQQRSSSKRHAQASTFRGQSQFTYSFQVQPTPPENVSPTQSQLITR